jgi:CRISPR-associated protein Cmr4
MYKESKTLFLLTETPLHAGSGDDLGVVDLPIQRERHTQYPKIEASSLKGALRQAFEAQCSEDPTNDPTIAALFGPEDADNNGHAGAMAFTDARILLFPVKSVKGVFAWITCPAVLERLKSDLSLTKTTDFPEIPLENKVPKGSKLIVKNQGNNQGMAKGNIVLEEYTFVVEEDEKCTVMATWLSDHLIDSATDYRKSKIKIDLAVLSNDDFCDFVQLSTEVITRIKIDNKTGTVEDGALFTEEYLPSESVMYSVIFAAAQFFDIGKAKNDIEFLKKLVFKEAAQTMNSFSATLTGETKINNIFQLGGNTTLGKGILRAKLI